jgi:methylmalonyl-CoA mutase
LELRSFAEPFEHLRDASDAWLHAHGVRPRVFLANLGTAADFTARASYAKNFFEAGGYEAIEGGGGRDAAALVDEFARSGARTAVVCSSDKMYAELAAEMTRRLKGAGARCVVLAGRPGEQEAAYREAGVDRFIYIGCNVLDTLQEMLREEGVPLS